jgi:hypothetical protein
MNSPPPAATAQKRGVRAAALASSAAASWFSLRIADVRWCRSPRLPSQRALGVAIELENRTDAWMQVRDHDVQLADDSGRKIVRSLPPIGSECSNDRLGVMRPRETKRGWFYFAPATDQQHELVLLARLREPHGFDAVSLELGLPANGAAGAPAPTPPVPARPAPAAGLAPPVETAFYRVTVTAARLCNAGEPLADGRRLLGVEVLLENFASVDLEPSYTARLLDSNGAEYESAITAQSGCEPKARAGALVRPGDQYRSFLWAFPIPVAGMQFVLVYRVRGSALDAWEEVRIPIGDLRDAAASHDG